MAVLALVLPVVVVAAPAGGSEPASVDAGTTVHASVGDPLPLSGTLEGFSSGATVAWSGPADCVLGDASALVTTATCELPGPHVFTLAASDGAHAASDDVRVEVTRESTMPLYQRSGTAPVPQQGLFSFAGTSFMVPPDLARMVATLDWEDNTPLREDLDLSLTRLDRTERAATAAKPEVLVVQAPGPGAWTARIDGRTALNTPYSLDVVGVMLEGYVAFPTVSVPSASGAPGETVTLVAKVEGAAEPATVTWELDPASRRFDDGAGLEFSFVMDEPKVVRAKLTDADGREFVAETLVRPRGSLGQPLTVVAVIDGSYSPYHYDFLGSQHPWNRDDDPANDVDFTQHPASYLPGAPQAVALPITIPDGPGVDVNVLRTQTDKELWASMQASSAANPRPYWFPGTKVVAALKFSSGAFEASNAAHGTASGSVAAGNIHGSCPECLFVLMNGNVDEAIRWATAQPWIDVITNSYGSGSLVQGATLGVTRDNMYWRSPVDATRAASEAGQVIVFSAGNGFLNAFDVPMLTYWSSQKGPDWMVTVGAVAPNSRQTYSGAGKPVDISSIGSSYPASGGSTANGVGTHGGTSNAAPVTAGYFAKVIQEAREALGDVTPGHASGVVASGTPVACGEAVPDCPLGDGVLTRVELEDAIYANVLPSNRVIAVDTVWPTTEYAYYYQGHGVLVGRLRDDATWASEWGRMAAYLVGDVAPYPRPAGETNWFIIDSKCRQHLWGAWSGGDYSGVQPTLDPETDPLAVSVDAWCSRVPEKVFLEVEAIV